ncbi:MAG TPA: hypothetical protein VK459_26655 [Polyangiaceae bacterium]|nr:hypothetical protein [Polyangiaceae bacterium]
MWLGAGEAQAQGNYQNAPLGGRSSIMGGTGVALGVDGAAPFLNPATLSRIEDKKLAFSSRFFGYFQRSFDDWQAPGAVDPGRVGDLQIKPESQSLRYLAILPDSACIYLDWTTRKAVKSKSRLYRAPVARATAGSGKLGACLARTEESSFEMNALNFAGNTSSGRVNQTQTIGRLWSSWTGGPSFAFAINEDISIGAAFYAVKNRYVSNASVSTIVGGSGEVLPSSVMFQSSMEAQSWDALAHVGVLYRLNETLTAGLSLRTPSIHVYDAVNVSVSQILGGAMSDTRYWSAGGSFETSSPARISVGLGAEWDRLRLEINGFLYVGLEELARADMIREGVSIQPGITPVRTLDRLTLIEGASPVANVGIGSEFFLTRDLSLMTGFSTDFSAIAPLSETEPYASRIFHDRANGVHGGIGVASYTDYGDLVMGLRGSYLYGETSAVNTFVSPALLEGVDYKGFSVVLVVAGRVSAGSVKEAAEDVGDAVKGEAPQPVGKPTEPMREPVKKDEE